MNLEKEKLYKSHTSSSGLISLYGKNIIEAVRERDRKAAICFKYMEEKTKNLKF